MSIYDAPIATLSGEPSSLQQYADKALLIVNVASKCGLTPQYEALQALHDRFADRGLVVIGVPCNQFMGQEPGTPDEIAEFCSVNYGVTFPLTEKVDVNGDDRHAVYAELVDVADADGYTGDIRWNFEKFVVAPGAASIVRFDPQTKPDAAEVTAAIEAVLPD